MSGTHRLGQLREYRSRLFNDATAQVHKLIDSAAGKLQLTPEEVTLLNDRARKCQLRIRVINLEIDSILTDQPWLIGLPS